MLILQGMGKAEYILFVVILEIVFIGLALVFKKFTKVNCRKIGVNFGLVFCIIQLLGKSVQEEWWIFPPDRGVVFLFLLGTFVLGVFVGLIASIIYQYLENRNIIIDEGKGENNHYKYFRVYIILLACYLICYIAYFPGCMSYDSGIITAEALGIVKFSNFHPFIHTLIWCFFIHMEEWLGIEQTGIILYTITQLLIMTAIYTYAFIWIEKRASRRIEKIFSLIYYCLNPTFHIFTLILTKDVYFSGIFLLLNIELIDYFEEVIRKEYNKVRQFKVVFLLVLCCLFRNNMIYVVMAFLFLILLIFRKNFFHFKYLFLSVVIYYFVVGIIYPSIGVSNGSIKEMLSVPMSQIAAVYQRHADVIENDDRELIENYIPDFAKYNRFFADNIKDNFNEDAFLKNKAEFLGLWVRLFKAYPVEYMNAFLSLNLPYWYTQMDSVREYIETGNYSQRYPVQRLNLLPEVYEWYEAVSENQAYWMHWPIFKQIYCIGMPIWILLFFEVWFIVKKKKVAAITIMPAILLWMTYLLGPVSNFRYIEPLLLTYPVWFTLAVEKETIILDD